MTTQALDSSKYCILIVDDDPVAIRMLGGILGAHGSLSFATNADDALSILRDNRHDLVLLDAEMPDVSGADLCRKLKSEPPLADIPVIFVTARSEPEFEATCFDLGAVDYVQKPVQPKTMVARVRTHLRMKSLHDELRHSARVDPLTGTFNRRILNESLQKEWARSLRSGVPLSIAMIDIDHFKVYNDHYGHLEGDACLTRVAAVLGRSASRASDIVARYGGEEFVLVMPETSADGALAVAQRIQRELEEAAIAHAASPVASYVTASLGLSTFVPGPGHTARRSDPPPRDLPAPSDLLASADRALYLAKCAGRNQVRFVDLRVQPTAPDRHAVSPRAC